MRRSALRTPFFFFVCLLTLAQMAAAQSLVVIEDPAERLTTGKTFTLLDGFAASDALPPFYLHQDPSPLAMAPRSGRNIAYASGRSALGAWAGPVTIDYFSRRDWWLDSSAGGLRYYELARQDALVASGETLNVDYRWQGFDGDGLRVSFADRLDLFALRDSVMGFSLAALRVQKLRRESARGQFSSDGSTASLNAQREIWYSGFSPATSNDSLTSFTPVSARPVRGNGYGYSVDFGFHHDFGLDSRLRFAVTDLFSYLKWDGVPHTVQSTAITGASADTDLAASHPGVTQQSTYDDLHFRLPAKVMLAIDYAPNYRWRLHGEQIWHRDQAWLTLGASGRLSDAVRLRADYDLRWKTVGLQFSYRRFVLAVRADSFSPRRAHASGASLRFELDY